MSFFRRKKDPEPAPRPVTQAIEKSTPAPVIQAAAEQEVKKDMRKGAGQRRTKLTGATGLRDEAQTRFKSLLGR